MGVSLSGILSLIFVCHKNATTLKTVQCSCSKVQLINLAKMAFPFHFCLLSKLKTTLLSEKLDFCYDNPNDSVASKIIIHLFNLLIPLLSKWIIFHHLPYQNIYFPIFPTPLLFQQSSLNKPVWKDKLSLFLVTKTIFFF